MSNLVMSNRMSNLLQKEKRSLLEIEERFIVRTIGLQRNGMWAADLNCTLNSDGQLVQKESSFVWIAHTKLGKSLGLIQSIHCISIVLPLGLSMLTELPNCTTCRTQFFSGLMTIASCVMGLHYELFLPLYENCLISIAFGPSSTEKITDLKCGLAIVRSLPRFLTSNQTNNRTSFSRDASSHHCLLESMIVSFNPRSKS